MKTAFKVGVFFIVGLVILLAVFEFVGEIPFLRKEYTLKTYFKSVGELKEGNPVKLQGVEVGKVSAIRIVDGKIEVTMRIKKDVPVRTDSVATIKLTSLLGTSYINLTFGSPTSPLATPGSVLASREPADISEMLVKLESAISSVESTVGSIESVFTENREKLDSILTGLDSVFGSMSRGEGTLGKLLKDDSLYNEGKQVLANLREISASIKEGKGTLGKLVKDEALYNETKKTMENLGNLASRLNSSQGTFGKLMNDDTLYDQAAQAATKLNSILDKINRGEGTLGKLVSDDSLYFDTKNAVKRVERSIDVQEDLAPVSTLGAILGVITIF